MPLALAHGPTPRMTGLSVSDEPTEGLGVLERFLNFLLRVTASRRHC